VLIARQLLFALEHAGFKVFPDFRLAWHFDDKVGQKYLFEALDIPRLHSYVFVESAPAYEWAAKTTYPKVFKLRHGAASSCVRLVRSQSEARRLIRRAFGRGYSVYNPWENLKERFYTVRLGASNAIDIAKGFGRFLYPPRFSRVLGRQRGYVYFQDFAQGNDSDVRISVVGDKAFGLRRWVRPGDFRASGSKLSSYDCEQVDLECVALAFKLAERLGGQCLAFDFIRKEDNSLAVIEISYGFNWKGKSAGYWDRDLNWCVGRFRPEDWMVDMVLESLR
jgi:glutathione synthase/RimK-type ligase-like ATP-grasp enzyme